MATPGRSITEQEVREIRRLRSVGLSIRQIAAVRMLSKSTVEKHLKEALTSGTNVTETRG